MSRPPLGQVCMELGLLDEPQVERILQDMREHGQGRFGELAVGLNLLSEQELAQALAQQFHVPLLPADRLARLSVPQQVLSLLPVSLMRGRVILPTFLEPDRRTLSIVTSDPTDLPTLQAAQRHARADRLRIFLAARSALASQLDRLLPAADSSEPSHDPGPDLLSVPGQPGTVVLETDVEIASALRRLDRAEGGRAQIVQDPEQVTAILRAGLAERVLYREALTDAASAYLPVWRKVRPGVQVAGVRGFSPGRRVAVGYRSARSFYQELLLWLLTTGSGAMSGRDRVREAYRLTHELGEQIRLSEEQVEAVSLAAMMAEVGEQEDDHQDQPHTPALRHLDTRGELLERFSPPWDLSGLYAALDRRLNRPTEVTQHLAAELLLVVRHAVARGTAGITDATDVLDPNVRYLPRLRTALTQVLQRRVLRAQLLTGGRRRAVVVAAVSDALLLTDIERRLEPCGFEVMATLDGDRALAWTRELRPSAVLVSSDLDDDGARRLLAEIRHDSPIADTPLVVLGAGSQLDARHLADLRPDCVIAAPHDLARLEHELRHRAPLGGPVPDRTATATGDTRGQPIQTVLALLQASGQTATIQIASPGDHGTVHVVDGKIHGARLGRITGDDAWIEIQALDQARYAVAFGKRPDIEDQAEVLRSVGVAP